MSKPYYSRYSKQIIELPFKPEIGSRVALLKTFKRIAKIYGVKLHIEKKGTICFYNSDQEFIRLDLCKFGHKGIFRSGFNLITLFTHELGHRIQHIQGGDGYYDYRNLGECVMLEWEAESISYYLTKTWFGQNIHHKRFTWMRSNRDIDFLREWYGL